MKKYLNNISKIIAAFSLIVPLSVFAGAPPPPPPPPPAPRVEVTVEPPTEMVAAINSLVGGYGADAVNKHMLFPTPYHEYSAYYGKSLSLINTDPTMLTPPALSPVPIVPMFMQPTLPLSSQAVNVALNAGTAYIQILQKMLVDTECKSPGGIGVFQSSCPTDTAPLDFNTLIGPSRYDQDKMKSALLFVAFAGGMAHPQETLDFEKEVKPKLKEGNANALAYMTALRAYAASQSVGLSNLFEMYAQRVPQKNLAKEAGWEDKFPGETKDGISPLQLDEYSAKRRITNENWYISMETATPVTVQREMLYVLAEMRQEMFKTRMAIERLTATMSVLQTENNDFNARIDFEGAKRKLTAKTPGA